MKSRYIWAMATATLLATSCTESKWEPGPDENPNSMTVYFEQLSSYDIVVEPDDSRLIPVTVGRAKNEEAASVSITSTAPEGVIVPQSVDFEAGEYSKTIYIDVENMASKSSGTITMTLPEEMTSPYGAGNASMSLNVTVSGAWMLLSDNVIVQFATKYGLITNSLYILDGTHNFKIPNFLNSGVDFVFTVDSPGDGNLGIVPLKNFLEDGDQGWYLYDEATDTFPAWSPDGALPYIYQFFGLSVTGYSFINFYSGYARVYAYIIYEDGTANYEQVWLYLNLQSNPFDTSGVKSQE